MTTYDIIIIGAGAMGSAAAYHAAKAGQHVLVFEQFAFDHGYGSSHGASRIIRYAYTDPAYVALAKAAYPMWTALEADAVETLMIKTGGIDYAMPGEGSFRATLNSLSALGIDYEMMDAAEAMRRFPQFRLDDGMIVSYQADYGVLKASNCVLAHVRLAERYGATMYQNTRVTTISPTSDGVNVVTEDGSAYSAARLIITAGAWARGLLKTLDLELPLQPVRCQEVYFQPENDAERYDVGLMPIFIHHEKWLTGEAFYGIPSVGGSGVKVAMHGGTPVTPDEGIDYVSDDAAVERSRGYARQYLPAVGAGRLVSTRICLYTMTPDEDFIVDQHPAYAQILIGSPCSGHGFKFSTLIGKILVDLACDGATDHDIEKFTLRRFD